MYKLIRIRRHCRILSIHTNRKYSSHTHLPLPLSLQAYVEFMGFVNILNDAVKGKTLSDPVPASPVIEKLVKLIEKLSLWVDETPAIDQPQRFGNKAFRTWWEKIRDVSSLTYCRVELTKVHTHTCTDFMIRKNEGNCKNYPIHGFPLMTTGCT